MGRNTYNGYGPAKIGEYQEFGRIDRRGQVNTFERQETLEASRSAALEARTQDTPLGRPPVFSAEARARWAEERERAERIVDLISDGSFELTRHRRGRG